MTENNEQTESVYFDDISKLQELIGPHGRHLAKIAADTGVTINHSGNELLFSGDERTALDLAISTVCALHDLLMTGNKVFDQDVECALKVLAKDPKVNIGDFLNSCVYPVSPKKTIRPRTMGQRTYLQSINDNDLTFGIGPAGTGKTYLAVAIAVAHLVQKKVKRIVLTRPAVEAGEKLGFLPGDLVEKINPYLRPLYDALHDMLDFDRVQEMKEHGIIEIAPLAFMRGRTLNNAFIILDEAQNTTQEQMKMFLTRMGFGSKVVVTGDVTQIDLPGSSGSGLIHAHRVLQDVKGIGIVGFDQKDVIRHPLVGRVVKAYEQAGEK